MKAAEIIEALRVKLAVSSGRHLYGVLGSYDLLEDFAVSLRQARTQDRKRFPKPINVNSSILKAIPDGEFRQLVKNEARRPEPTAAHVAKAFGKFLRSRLHSRGFVILSNLEILFAYHLELSLLRTMAADDNTILLLLPGKRIGGKVIMFPEWEEGDYMLPTNLIADNNLWELKVDA